jgi:hypothetical protein
MDLLDLFRKLNVRSALAVKSFTDILEGKIKKINVTKTKNIHIYLEYQQRQYGFYDIFSDTFYAYRSIMLHIDYKDLNWQCPACPQVFLIFNFFNIFD